MDRPTPDMSQKLFYEHIIPATDAMYRFALSIVRDEAAAQDIVQDCLVKIWKRRSQISSIENHESWCLKIVRNKCLDWLKRKRFSTLWSFEKEPSYRITADHDLNVNDYEKWLSEVLNSLSTKQREVFHLREIEEYAYDEIADVLRMSMNDVKVNLHRARMKVREKMLKLENYGIAN